MNRNVYSRGSLNSPPGWSIQSPVISRCLSFSPCSFCAFWAMCVVAVAVVMAANVKVDRSVSASPPPFRSSTSSLPRSSSSSWQFMFIELMLICAPRHDFLMECNLYFCGTKQWAVSGMWSWLESLAGRRACTRLHFGRMHWPCAKWNGKNDTNCSATALSSHPPIWAHSMSAGWEVFQTRMACQSAGKCVCNQPIFSWDAHWSPLYPRAN